MKEKWKLLYDRYLIETGFEVQQDDSSSPEQNFRSALFWFKQWSEETHDKLERELNRMVTK